MTWTTDPASVGISIPRVTDIELSEDGTFVGTVADEDVSDAGRGRTVNPAESFTKTSGSKARKLASVPFQYIVGNYTINGAGGYVIDGFGVITVTGSGKSTKGSIQFEGADGLVYGMGDMLDTPYYQTTTESTRYICRIWRITATDITIKGPGIDYGHYFTDTEGGNGDLPKLAKHIIDNAHLNLDESQFNNLGTIGYIRFARNGTIQIQYNKKTAYFGIWKWNNEANGDLSWVWDDKEMGNDLVNYSGTANFKWYHEHIAALLTLNAKIVVDGKEYQGKIQFTLRHM